MLDKNDIKQIKELLAPLATKEELKLLATKEDLKGLATKKDLKEEIDGLATMIIKSFNNTEERMAEGFKSINDRLDKVEKVEKRVAKIEQVLAVK